MVWRNCFTLGGFTVSYSPFQMAWEVLEKRDGCEVAFRWFYSKKKAEAFCIAKPKVRGLIIPCPETESADQQGVDFCVSRPFQNDCMRFENSGKGSQKFPWGTFLATGILQV